MQSCVGLHVGVVGSMVEELVFIDQMALSERMGVGCDNSLWFKG